MFKKLGFFSKKSRKKTIHDLDNQDLKVKEKDKLSGGQFTRSPGFVSNDNDDTESFI